VKKELYSLFLIEYWQSKRRVREKIMKSYLKYSILAILALTITVGLVHATPVVPIGLTAQPSPFDSNPTSWTRQGTGLTVTNGPNAYDGDFDFQAQIKPAATGSPTGIWFQVTGFTTSAQFTPGWVDLKIRYDIPQGSDDSHRIEYQVAPSTAWIALVPDTTNGFSTAVQPFAQITEPNDGVWSWDDIASLKVRVYYTKVGSYVLTEMTMNIWEIWATVYPMPLPPEASPTVSVQPSGVGGVTPNPGVTWMGNIMYVDVYVQGVTALAGYEFTMQYDNSILSYADSFSYWPWVDVVTTPDDASGLVNIVATAEPPVVDVGFTGNSPMARVYFTVLASGTSNLNLIVSKLGQPGGIPITHTVHNGFFASPHYLSYKGGIFPDYTDPTGSVWHEDYPTFSNTWTVQGWTDNGDGILSPSDQLTIEVNGEIRQYHVDQVTTTIHWTFKTAGEGIADPEDPATPPDYSVDPTDSRWHQIYPDYCRAFTITGWTDQGSGTFDPSDQFQITYDDDGSVANAHLDAITTNILVSQKPGGPVPEFPFGLTAMMALVAAMPLVYMWRTRRKVIKK
jgi:hypothetical protein